MHPAREISIGNFRIGGNQPLVLIAGPCVIESEAHAFMMAERLAEIAAHSKMPLVFKASYDKANRSSEQSFRGPGLKEGIPAFLSRQTDLLAAAGKTGRVVNLKKGQFLSPWEMANAVEKISSTGNERVILSERGASFGYQNLVVDMRSFPILLKTGCPVVFDVTHSVQLPGGEGKSSGGQPEFIEPLARAGTAVGVDGIFLEVHENPAKALSDGTNALPLAELPALLGKLTQIAALVRGWSVQ